MTHILHPTDLSQTSAAAFRHALRLALNLRGRLTILYADQSSVDDEWASFPGIRQALRRWGVVRGEISPREIPALTGMKIDKVAFAGHPLEAVTGFLSRHPVDLMVLGTEGRTGIAALSQPSVARSLSRTSRMPVLFVREGIRGFVSGKGAVTLQTVIVPVDTDPDPQLAVDWTSRFEQWCGSPIGNVIALHVGETELSPPVSPPHLNGGTFNNRLEQGMPEETILDVAERRMADLLVMSRAGPASMRERWVGSTTERIVLAAPCPVLTIPGGDYNG